VNIYTNTSGVVVVQKWGPYSVPMATNICMCGLTFLHNVVPCCMHVPTC